MSLSKSLGRNAFKKNELSPYIRVHLHEPMRGFWCEKGEWWGSYLGQILLFPLVKSSKPRLIFGELVGVQQVTVPSGIPFKLKLKG